MDSPVREDKRFKLEGVLLDALKAALADPREHRLFRAGKLDGLFPSKLGLSLEAAHHALRHGFLESVRTEAKGPVSVEWVRIAPSGVEFVYSHDSPRSVLGEMRNVLVSAKAGVPGMMAGVQEELKALATRFAAEIDGYTKRLDALTQRVEEAIRRMDSTGPMLADPLQALIPWGYDALIYLDQRKQTRRADPCTLAELFEALLPKHPALDISQFHDGLRRLADNRAVKMHAVPPDSIDRPEYALIDGSKMLYHVER